MEEIDRFLISAVREKPLGRIIDLNFINSASWSIGTGPNAAANFKRRNEVGIIFRSLQLEKDKKQRMRSSMVVNNFIKDITKIIVKFSLKTNKLCWEEDWE
ncbi:hypothetical protein QMN03_09820 [Leptospira santarosai]|uniref:hypothetical protein n=1 Tax=Leptospira santarosai TaxID=28183 RepID=UPI0024AED103|nr:hypothetical protein [Leptospira santarosai]MDI7207192.1 hypothetical protein [Leptospira santarosai]